MRRLASVVVCLWISGCSLAVGFDRSRLDAEGPSLDAGSPPDGSSSTDGGTDASVADAGVPDGGSDSGTVELCDVTDNTGCAADQRCCDRGGAPTCVMTDLAECEACGEACGALVADQCTDGACRCGSGAVCTDGERCIGGECVECENSSECTDQQCVAGRCVDCNPTDGAGCAGTTPICDGSTFTCRACSDDCPTDLTCAGSGECVGCDPMNNAGCSLATTPFCDRGTGGDPNICVGCTYGGSGDADCSSDYSLDFCQMDGRCGACDPNGDRGCDGATPVCSADSGGSFACVACTADAQCADRTATPVCDEGSGRCVACDAANAGVCPGADAVCLSGGTECVQCNVGADCGADSLTPVCGATNTCGACASNGECGGGLPICVESGGRQGACGVCDPADGEGCSGTTPVCEPTDATCRACSGDGECGGGFCTVDGSCQACDPADGDGCSDTTPVCAAGTFICEACTADEDCGALFCAESGGLAGACVDCDPSDGGGCDASAPFCDAATAECRGCLDAAECMGAALGDFCVGADGEGTTGVCGACDPGDAMSCSGATPVCDPATLTCVACTDNASCGGGFECVAQTWCVCVADMGAGCSCADGVDCSDGSGGGGAEQQYCEAGSCIDCGAGTCGNP